MQLFEYESRQRGVSIFHVIDESRNSFWLLLLSLGNPYIAWRGPDWTWPRLGHLSCHVCLCNSAKLPLQLRLRLRLLLLAYANARHCYCDSFLWLQQLWLNMYAKCDLHITRPKAERRVEWVRLWYAF